MNRVIQAEKEGQDRSEDEEEFHEWRVVFKSYLGHFFGLLSR